MLNNHKVLISLVQKLRLSISFHHLIAISFVRIVIGNILKIQRNVFLIIGKDSKWMKVYNFLIKDLLYVFHNINIDFSCYLYWTLAPTDKIQNWKIITGNPRTMLYLRKMYKPFDFLLPEVYIKCIVHFLIRRCQYKFQAHV